MKKFEKGLICLIASLFNVIFIAFALQNFINTTKTNNIYIAALVASPILNIFITKLLTKCTTSKINFLHLYYSSVFSLLIAFIYCSFLLKTFELISLIVFTIYIIFNQFLTPISFDWESAKNEFFKNSNGQAYFQNKKNLIILVLETAFLILVCFWSAQGVK